MISLKHYKMSSLNLKIMKTKKFKIYHVHLENDPENLRNNETVTPFFKTH